MRIAETLLDESRVHRVDPVNLREADRALFAHERERQLPAVRLREYRSVEIDAWGILFQNNRPLGISFASPDFAPGFHGFRTRCKYALRHFRRRRISAPEEIFWFTDNLSHEYFHWLTDALPRLWLIRDRIAGQMLWLPEKFGSKSYVAESLKHWNLGGIRYLDKAELLICPRVWIPEPAAPSGNYRDSIINELHAFYAKDFSERGERLYISRARAPRRRIENETAVIDCLASLGFRTVHLEDLAWPEQVATLGRAGCIISNHGAGLTNLLFAPRGAAVMELRQRDDAVNNCYYSLAAARELDYYYLLCDAVNPGEDLHTADIRVEIGELEREVRRMLAGKSAL